MNKLSTGKIIGIVALIIAVIVAITLLMMWYYGYWSKEESTKPVEVGSGRKLHPRRSYFTTN